MKKLWLIAAALVAYLWIRHDGAQSAELARWKQAAQGAIVAGNAYRASRDSLAKQESILRRRYGALNGDLERLRATSDSLSRVADTAQTIGPYREALIAANNVGATCRATLAVADSGWSTCAVRARLAEARAAKLDSLLRQGLKVQTCRVLGLLPCPSRGLVFLGGAVGGYLLSRR